jgi:hypothetical protein
MSENPLSADNQQERFRGISTSAFSYYVAGFVDGEGSFNVSFRKRSDYSVPWKVSACFNISQKEKRILELVREHLGCGTLRSRPDGIWYYEVNDLRDLRTIIIPFFEKYPFLSQKKIRDFRIFCAIVTLLSSSHHLSQEGIEQILRLRETMNGGGKRKFSTEEILQAFPQKILRDYTSEPAPFVEGCGEDIVRSHRRL